VNRSCAGDFFPGCQDAGVVRLRVKGWMYVKGPAGFMFFTACQGAVPGWTAAANYPPLDCECAGEIGDPLKD